MSRNLETVKQQIMDLDPNLETSMLVCRTIQNGISCYRKLYEQKKKVAPVQMTLDKYFSRKEHPFFTRFVTHLFNNRFLAFLLFIILHISMYTVKTYFKGLLTNVPRYHG
jgi:hypothetical protein